MRLISLPMTWHSRLTLVDDGRGWIFSSWHVGRDVVPGLPSAEHRRRTFRDPKAAVAFFVEHYGPEVEARHVRQIEDLMYSVGDTVVVDKSAFSGAKAKTLVEVVAVLRGGRYRVRLAVALRGQSELVFEKRELSG